MILGNPHEFSVPEDIGPRVADVREMKRMAAHNPDRERGGNTSFGTEPSTQSIHARVRMMHDGGEIRLFTGRERMNRPRDFIHRVLSSFGSTGKAADTVGDTENACTFIAKKPVFVVSADSADIGERCGAEQGHEF